jgi:hypothetical protein
VIVGPDVNVYIATRELDVLLDFHVVAALGKGAADHRLELLPRSRQLSLLAHGLTAAPLADHYARWHEQHPRDKAPLESAPTAVTRPRGPAEQ